MLTMFLISLAAALGWLIKDRIHEGSAFQFSANWKKYVGCLVAGLLYGFISGLTIFRWIGIIAVIYLVGVSFEAVLNVLNWILSQVGAKKVSP